MAGSILRNMEADNSTSEEEYDYDHVTLTRFPKTQSILDEMNDHNYDEPTCGTCEKEKITCKSFLGYIISLLPILNVIRQYRIREYLLRDVISGLSAASLHFPQGLAFGLLASLAPKNGLYTSFFAVMAYVIFGTSPYVSFGVNAVIALFTADLVDNHIDKLIVNTTRLGDDEILDERASLAAGSSFIIGITLLVLGLLRLGIISSYMSASFVSAFTTTAAFHIITSQIPKALGITIPSISGPGKLVLIYIEIGKQLKHVNIGCLVTSILSGIILVFFKDFINEKFRNKMPMPVPADLLMVILGTIISYFCKIHEKYDIPVIGHIPSGLPLPHTPTVRTYIILESLVIAIIIFVLTISMTKICEEKHGRHISDNQELVAYGMCNFVGSIFRCFPSCVAPPRTIILSTMGAKTTLNGIFTAFVLLLLMLFLGKYFEHLPIPVLAMMVIIAIKNLLSQFRQLPTLWRVNKYDFCVWIVTIVCGVFIDLPYALYCGLGMSILIVVVQTQNGRSFTLQKLNTEDLYIEPSQSTTSLPYTVIFKMESPLFFATAGLFRERLYKLAGYPKKCDKMISVTEVDDDECSEMRRIIDDSYMKYIIIDCSSFNYVDMDGVNTLLLLVRDYSAVGTTILLIRCTRYFLTLVHKSELRKAISEDCIVPDVVDALFAINKMSTNDEE